jgi:hypothetical protein
MDEIIWRGSKTQNRTNRDPKVRYIILKDASPEREDTLKYLSQPNTEAITRPAISYHWHEDHADCQQDSDSKQNHSPNRGCWTAKMQRLTQHECEKRGGEVQHRLLKHER